MFFRSRPQVGRRLGRLAGAASCVGSVHGRARRRADDQGRSPRRRPPLSGTTCAGSPHEGQLGYFGGGRSELRSTPNESWHRPRVNAKSVLQTSANYPEATDAKSTPDRAQIDPQVSPGSTPRFDAGSCTFASHGAAYTIAQIHRRPKRATPPAIGPKRSARGCGP